MAKKFIKQIRRDDFEFPNEQRAQYGDEIYHDINNNAPTGTVDSIDNIALTTNNISFDVTWTYNRNNCELFQLITGGTYTIVTFHLLAPDQDYYKPWRLVEKVISTNSALDIVTGTTSVSASISDMGLTGFTDGDYILEVRFIGKRAVDVVQAEVSATAVTATPTPTPTPTPVITGTCLPLTGDMYEYDTPSCDELSKVGLIMRSDTGDICNATLLWEGADCSTLASAKWYHMEGETCVRHWNGSAFDDYYTCASVTPTPTPTPTVTATPSIYYYWELYRCIDGTSNWYIKSTNAGEWHPGDAIWGAVECDPYSAFVVSTPSSTTLPSGSEITGTASDYSPCTDCDNNPIPS